MSGAEAFRRARGTAGSIPDIELDRIWAELPTVSVSEMIGAWRGGEFETGHPLNGQLEKASWHGKHFVSPDDVAPLVCRDEDGRLFANTTLGHGDASLWLVEFRGELTASMVYDGQPVIDHFKRVDDDTVMGIMNTRANRKHQRWFYFWLERDDVPFVR